MVYKPILETSELQKNDLREAPNGLRKRIGETENRDRQRKLLNMEGSVKKKA